MMNTLKARYIMYFAERPTASHPTPPEDKDEAVGTHLTQPY